MPSEALYVFDTKVLAPSVHQCCALVVALSLKLAVEFAEL